MTPHIFFNRVKLKTEENRLFSGISFYWPSLFDAQGPARSKTIFFFFDYESRLEISYLDILHSADDGFGASAAFELIVAVVVITRSDTDVTSWWCRSTDGILSFGNRNLDLMLRQRVNVN